MAHDLHQFDAEEFRRLRLSHGMSIRAVARAASVSDSNLSKVARGKVQPGPATVKAVAEVLSVEPCRLYRGAA